MGRLRYLNPIRIYNAVSDVRRVLGGGGPKLVRVVGIGRPEGIFIPTAPIRLEVESKTGRKARFEPMVPVPWLAAWSYRLARGLGVPLISDVDPEQVKFELRVPRKRG
jgi:hypothetical protein